MTIASPKPLLEPRALQEKGWGECPEAAPPPSQSPNSTTHKDPIP